MIAFKITQNKDFMNKLLLGTTFDNFLLSEAVVQSFVSFTIDGSLSLSYYSEEELEDIGSRKYITWSQIKPYLYQIISGNRTPLSMKIILLLSHKNTAHIIQTAGIQLTADDINGLFVNIRFENGAITVTTGTSLSFFTLDRTLEHAWDKTFRKFLTKYNFSFDET